MVSAASGSLQRRLRRCRFRRKTRGFIEHPGVRLATGRAWDGECHISFSSRGFDRLDVELPAARLKLVEFIAILKDDLVGRHHEFFGARGRCERRLNLIHHLDVLRGDEHVALVDFLVEPGVDLRLDELADETHLAVLEEADVSLIEQEDAGSMLIDGGLEHVLVHCGLRCEVDVRPHVIRAVGARACFHLAAFLAEMTHDGVFQRRSIESREEAIAPRVVLMGA